MDEEELPRYVTNTADVRLYFCKNILEGGEYVGYHSFFVRQKMAFRVSFTHTIPEGILEGIIAGFQEEGKHAVRQVNWGGQQELQRAGSIA